MGDEVEWFVRLEDLQIAAEARGWWVERVEDRRAEFVEDAGFLVTLDTGLKVRCYSLDDVAKWVEATPDQLAEMVVEHRPVPVAVKYTEGPRPLCGCHEEAMRWQTNSGYALGGYWRCSVWDRDARRPRWERFNRAS